MTRFVNAALAAAAVLAAPVARAQLSSATDRANGLPAGLALPVLGAAAAEEPTALGVNPAGIGFVGGLALHYFHEEDAAPGDRADGLYAADRLGPFGLGGSFEWVRPGEGLGADYRRSRFALTLGDGQAFSAGVGWSWVASSDPGLAEASSWDAGLTLRPVRWLSVSGAALDLDRRVAGARVPARWDVGAATRLADDALTLSADLRADDADGQRFRVTHVVAGAGGETPFGFALSAQLQVPLRDSLSEHTSFLIALTWNGAHGGVTGATTSTRASSGWLAGVRASTERYRTASEGEAMPALDVADELEQKRTLFFFVKEQDPYGALVHRLQEARDDPEVAALVLKIDGLPLGAGRAAELREVIARIRERKPVLVYLQGGGTREYWVASAATRVSAPPGASFFVNGLAASQLFFKDTLARLGVAFEVVKAGAYKSAAEPLVRTEASPEAREATNAVLDDLYGRFVSDVAAARKLPPEKVRALVDQGLFLSEEARTERLIDDVVWPDEVERWARRVTGRHLHLTGRYQPEPEREAQHWSRPPVVEIVRVEGVIAMGKSRTDPLGAEGLAGADTVTAELRRAVADDEVKAIVLRVESPGGDGLAGDLIWREVVRARQKGKIVVASMGDVAASAGYLVAAGADAIVAEPSTLTGSIGVFAAKPDLSGTLEKLSIHREAAVRGEHALLTSILRPWSESERKVVQRQIDAFYGLFLDRVAEGRKLPRPEVEAVAGGRVWTGHQAFERRLVDRLGSVTDAVALAREKAGIRADDLVLVRRAGSGGGVLGRVSPPPLRGEEPDGALARLAAAVPELRVLSVLSELGPVLALPEEWVLPVTAP